MEKRNADAVLQELGREWVQADVEAGRGHRVYRVDLELRVDVSVDPRSMFWREIESADDRVYRASASPQIYFDSEDNFQKGHAIAAG